MKTDTEDSNSIKITISKIRKKTAWSVEMDTKNDADAVQKENRAKYEQNQRHG